MASRTRAGLVSPSGEVELATALDATMRRLFGRSLRLRSVVAGSCNGCEAELAALGNVVFDLARFGVQFVASPRHADGLLVTGVVTRNMADPLRNTVAATPQPRVVIACGDCALNRGVFRDAYGVVGAVDDVVPVDVEIAGCPPTPTEIIKAVRSVTER